MTSLFCYYHSHSQNFKILKHIIISKKAAVFILKSETNKS